MNYPIVLYPYYLLQTVQVDILALVFIIDKSKQKKMALFIQKDFENASPYFCTFLANRICH